jgi:hypothetical protein
MAFVAGSCRYANELRQISERANLTSRRWTWPYPRSPISIHPDCWNTGRLRPCYIELGGIADEDRILGCDPSESQRFTKYLGVRLCYAKFLGDKDEIDETVDSEELEFRVLHLCWSVGHDPDRAGCPGAII